MCFQLIRKIELSKFGRTIKTDAKDKCSNKNGAGEKNDGWLLFSYFLWLL